LIELLVVIAVVALLVAMILPTLGRARKFAGRVPCMANMHTMGTAYAAYTNDFKGILPWDGYAEGDRPERSVGPWVDSMQWFNVAPVYSGYPAYCEQQDSDAAGVTRLPRDGERGMFICPVGDPAVAAGGTGDLVTDGYFMLWGTDVTGTVSDRRKTYWSYGYNTQLDGGIEDRHLVGERVCVAIQNIKQPSVTVSVIEKIIRPDEYTPPFLSDVGQGQVSWREFTTRHENGGFLLMLDNHVQFFLRKDVAFPPGAPLNYNQPGKVVWSPTGASI